MGNADKEAIRRVIEEAYIRGIHETQDAETARSGFHQAFTMLVLQHDAIEKVTLDEWLPRIETLKAEHPELWRAETTHNIELIDVAGYTAVAKLDVHKGPVHFSTDYMLLYRFEDGWKIVSKTFAIPD